MKNEEVVRRFMAADGRNGTGDAAGHLRHFNGILWSYNTPIAMFCNGRLYVSIDKFSVSTSRHQSLVRQAAFMIYPVHGVQRGDSVQTFLDLALEQNDHA